MKLVFLLLVLASGAEGQTADPPAWKALQRLTGEWKGEGTGQPGVGAGGFSFTSGLQGKVLIRKNRAEYPASGTRPAFVHEDLMVIYVEAGRVGADYYDNEGHLIRYAVTAPAGGKEIVFLSERKAAAVTYRFTYSLKDANTVGIQFEIAPPDRPDQFTSYVSAVARRAR